MRIVPTALYFDIILTDPLCRRSHCLSRRGREQRVLPMPLLLLWKDGRTGAACHPQPIFLWTECRSPPHTPIVEESSASLEGAEENPPRASSPRFPFLILKNKEFSYLSESPPFDSSPIFPWSECWRVLYLLCAVKKSRKNC